MAGDGNEALRVLGTERIDVAVLDVMMPGPERAVAVPHACARAATTAMPVILLTALGEEDDRIAGLEAGADDYLTKPFSPRELALRVRSVLRRAPVAGVGGAAGDQRRRTDGLHRRAVGHRRRRAGGADQPRIRSAAVLPDPHRHRLLPRGIAAAGVALGFR